MSQYESVKAKSCEETAYLLDLQSVLLFVSGLESLPGLVGRDVTDDAVHGEQAVGLALGGNVFGWTADRDASFEILVAFTAGGGDFIDTADGYSAWAPGNRGGESETIIGEWLASRKPRGLTIATKVSSHPEFKGLSAKNVRAAAEASLKRLGVETIDLYYAHFDDEETPLEETMQAFADVVRQGKALYIGVSEWTADQIREGHRLATELGIQLISSQPQYSMLWRVIEEKVVPTCAELGISQIVWSPIAQGVLSGKYEPGQAPPEGSRATDEKGGANMIKRFMEDDVLKRVQELKPVADELDLTMAQMAVAWVLQNDNVAAALVGASRPEQVSENVKAAGVKLPAEVMTAIDAALGDLAETDPSKTVSPDERPA